MIVDVHNHTPTHRDEVPESERLVFQGWRSDRPVVTTNSWAEFDQQQSAADITIVFNIAVDDPLRATGLPYPPERTNDATAEFVADGAAQADRVHVGQPDACPACSRRSSAAASSTWWV